MTPFARKSVAPLVLTFLGVGSGVYTVSLNLTGRAFDWGVLLPLAGLTAIVSFPVTMLLLGHERRSRVTWREHTRHMSVVYPFWTLGLAGGLGGSHVSSGFMIPCAALTGVMVGNLAAVIRSVRATA